MSSKGKRRRARPRLPEAEIGRPVVAQQRSQTRGERRARTRPRKPAGAGRPWLLLGAIAAVGLVGLAVVAFIFGWIPGLGPAAQPSPPAGSPPAVSPPEATPLANPPAEPSGDGTQVTIETELGNIVVELYNESAPVAAQNFANLAEAGFYEGVVFHRIIPGFMIQGGDPEGTGGGGPGYTIPDEPIVGEYVRGTVAMARTRLPNSQGSQFFIVVADSPHLQGGGYTIFGRVVQGMDVADQIVAGPRGGPNNDIALDPVAMTRVTVQRP